MIKYITLRNDFHNTEVRMKVKIPSGYFTKDQIRRARKNLCGVKECKCGGVMGERGLQDIEIRLIQGKHVHYDTKTEEK